MVNWSDPAEILKDSTAFEKICMVCFGIYMWEFLTTLGFEWSILTGKRSFKWPLIFYFWTRYALFWSLIAIAVALNVTTQINCQSLYTFAQFTGNTAIATASNCFMLRTIAVWQKKMAIVIPLIIISLGQWALFLFGIVSLKAQWVDSADACVVTQASPVVLDAIFLYTMSYDFIVLVLTLWGLLTTPGRSGLWSLIFRDGILYFALSFFFNVFPAVFNILNLNPAMNIIVTVPVGVAGTMTATRLVRGLQEFNNKDVYVHSSSSGGRGIGSTKVGSAKNYNPKGGLSTTASEGVHITMDTFTLPHGNRSFSKDEYDDRKVHTGDSNRSFGGVDHV